MCRFVVIEEKQIQNLLDDSRVRNTIRAAKVSFNCLRTYLKTRKNVFDFTDINNIELNEVFKKF